MSIASNVNESHQHHDPPFLNPNLKQTANGLHHADGIESHQHNQSHVMSSAHQDHAEHARNNKQQRPSHRQLPETKPDPAQQETVRETENNGQPDEKDNAVDERFFPTEVVVRRDEVRRLIDLAKARKRNRIPFFNSADGRRLRLSCMHHTPTVGRPAWCALCGWKRQDSNSWRGHKTQIGCDLCDVHLCIQIYPGTHISCWRIWHSTQRIAKRELERTQLTSASIPKQPVAVIPPVQSQNTGEDVD